MKKGLFKIMIVFGLLFTSFNFNVHAYDEGRHDYINAIKYETQELRPNEMLIIKPGVNENNYSVGYGMTYKHLETGIEKFFTIYDREYGPKIEVEFDKYDPAGKWVVIGIGYGLSGEQNLYYSYEPGELPNLDLNLIGTSIDSKPSVLTGYYVPYDTIGYEDNITIEISTFDKGGSGVAEVKIHYFVNDDVVTFYDWGFDYGKINFSPDKIGLHKAKAITILDNANNLTVYTDDIDYAQSLNPLQINEMDLSDFDIYVEDSKTLNLKKTPSRVIGGSYPDRDSNLRFNVSGSSYNMLGFPLTQKELDNGDSYLIGLHTESDPYYYQSESAIRALGKYLSANNLASGSPNFLFDLNLFHNKYIGDSTYRETLINEKLKGAYNVEMNLVSKLVGKELKLYNISGEVVTEIYFNYLEDDRINFSTDKTGEFVLMESIKIDAVDVPVTGITIPNKTLTAYKGQKLDLNVSVKPANASNKNIYYEVFDKYSGNVDQNGIFNAEYVGENVVIARTMDGGFVGNIEINILKEPSTKNSVYLNKTPNKKTYKVGDKISSSGGEIIKVNSKGKEEKIKVTNKMIKGYDFSKKGLGKQTVEVHYGNTIMPYDIYVNTFKDVKNGSSFYDYIYELYNDKIIKGYNKDTEFRPGNSLTRAQAAKMIVIAAGIDTNDVSSDFKDVNKASSSYQYISAASKAGVIDGFKDGTFKPNEPVKRRQIAKMITLGFGLNQFGKPTKFVDVEKISNKETRNYIYTLASLDIVKGYGEKFKPNDNLTRGQFSKIISISKASQDPSYRPLPKVPSNVPKEAQEMFDYVNLERRRFGSPDLEWSDRAYSSAKIRAKELDKKFSHTRPNGKEWASLDTEHLHGENISMGYQTPRLATTGFIDSPGHRSNILNENFKSAAMGHYKSKGTNYYAQLFSRDE